MAVSGCPEASFAYITIPNTWPFEARATTHYNALGQVDSAEDAANNRTTYTYDPQTGRRTATTNPLGNTTYTAYTDRGQLHRTWGDTPYPIEYGYDPVYGTRTTLKTYRGGTGWDGNEWPADPAAPDITTWNYHPATGLLASKIYADGKGTTYTYYDSGQLHTRTWARTVADQPLVTTYTYMPSTGELATVDYSDATPDITYSYTRSGAVDTVTDAAGTRTFTYNSALQLDSEPLPTALYGDKLITRKYETTGLPGRSAGFQLGTAADPDADQDITYAYDASGRFASITDELRTQTFSYGYLPNSDLLETTTLPNNVILTKAYEPNRNLVDYVQNKVGATTVSKYDYENDAAGRRTQAVRTGSAFDQANFDLWGYNTRSELTSSHRYQGSAPGDTSNPVTAQFYDYTYDPIGNRLGATVGNPNDPEPVEGARDTTYTTNSLNQYTSVSSVPSVVNPTYDDDGNMTFLPSTTGGGAGGEGWTLHWNAENRMVAAEKANDTKLEFAYDYMGRRISKKVYSWQIDAWQLDTSLVFLYDSWNLIAELDALNNNATVRSYTWGLDLSQSLQGAGGIGGLLALTDAGTAKTYAPTYDANGNVGQLIDLADGSTDGHYEYTPFGKTLTATGPAAALNPFRFSTKYAADETGLLYYGYRHYSPELGRWVGRDPIGEKGGVNLYGFVGNRAMNGLDALGLWLIHWIGPWTPQQQSALSTALTHVTNRAGAMLSRLSQLIAAANGLPDECAYKGGVLDELYSLRNRLQTMQGQLQSQDLLVLKLGLTWVTDEDDVPAGYDDSLQMGWFPSPFDPPAVLINPGGDACFFDLDPDEQMALLFHELYHAAGAPDERDNSDDWVDWPVNIQNWIRNPTGFCITQLVFHVEINKKKGKSCCPPIEWTCPAPMSFPWGLR